MDHDCGAPVVYFKNVGFALGGRLDSRDHCCDGLERARGLCEDGRRGTAQDGLASDRERNGRAD